MCLKRQLDEFIEEKYLLRVLSINASLGSEFPDHCTAALSPYSASVFVTGHCERQVHGLGEHSV